MKKSLIFSLVFIALAISAVGFAISQNNDTAQEQAAGNDASDMAPSDTKASQPAQSSSGGSYKDYSSSALASADGQRVLFFHAPWCPQCRSIEEGILKDGVPEGFTVIKVDYDSNQDLRKKYGVTLQTTFIKIDENGQQVAKYVAYDEPTFDSVKRELLQ